VGAVRQGTLVRGRYRLLGLLGRGGMGEVWRGEDEALGRKVAIKCLRAGLDHHDPKVSELQRERFRREARVAAGLQHPGITVVHDFGEAEDGTPFLVMELVDGTDLDTVLDGLPGRRMPVAEAVRTGRQIASALAYTHARDVIHRDLKPPNLLRTADGGIKICDFGIARLAGTVGVTSRLGQSGSPVGTPKYMSPEQIDDGDVDASTDLYSFGCVLYELLTGAPPFAVGDPLVIMMNHAHTPPRPPSEVRPEIPAEVERLVLDLLAKRPEDRPPDAMSVLRRLNLAASPQRPAVPALPQWAARIGPVPVSLLRVLPEAPGVTALTCRWVRR
jgi:serine/threonine-protein kinase